jgi:membrane protein implicated in regulation of membrane protease activity
VASALLVAVAFLAPLLGFLLVAALLVAAALGFRRLRRAVRNRRGRTQTSS